MRCRQELRSLFDPVVNRIIELVANQVERSSSSGRRRVNVCSPPLCAALSR